MKASDLDIPPVGVKILEETLEGFKDVPVYRGVSYCEAVKRASAGERLLLLPGSVEVCRWVPAVMGLKRAETDFEKSLTPRLDRPAKGIYIAPLLGWERDVEPDVVIIRGKPETLRRIAGSLGTGALMTRYRGQIGRTALGPGDGNTLSVKAGLSRWSNALFSFLCRWRLFDELTKKLFRSQAVTTAFEKLIRNTVADMSICRNSTVIPLLEDAGNISFLCAGGVTWGGNSPEDMTSGYPYHLIEKMGIRSLSRRLGQ